MISLPWINLPTTMFHISIYEMIKTVPTIPRKSVIKKAFFKVPIVFKSIAPQRAPIRPPNGLKQVIKAEYKDLSDSSVYPFNSRIISWTTLKTPWLNLKY